jgi:hypothetical protein
MLAQELDGLWFSKYRMNIQKNSESTSIPSESLEEDSE